MVTLARGMLTFKPIGLPDTYMGKTWRRRVKLLLLSSALEAVLVAVGVGVRQINARQELGVRSWNSRSHRLSLKIP